MRFASRCLPRKAAAYALLALSPLTAYSQDAATPENHGIVVANIDRSVKPGDDFFRYANGDWIKRTQVPTDSGYVAVGGWAREDQSTESSRRRTAAIIEEAIKANAPAGSTTRKIADLYRSYMDEAGIEAVQSMRPGVCAIGGNLLIWHISTQPLGRWSRSTTPTNPLQTSP